MRWLALSIGGQKIGVYVVRRKHRMLGGADGAYHPEKCAIYIASDLEEGARDDTLLHELDHAVNQISGVNTVLKEACRVGALDATEEAIVTARTPLWHRLLRDLGFRFPRGLHQ